MYATPENAPALLGMVCTVTVALAPFAKFPRSQTNWAPVTHAPWLVDICSIVIEASRFMSSVTRLASLGPRLLTVATHEIADPVVVVAGAIRVTEKTAGEDSISFTRFEWKM